uniref:Uncharacterized protein n=1 Tax=viral metagenome TaxID=1070528 RepID=A0A6C0JD20_9ZZZZ
MELKYSLDNTDYVSHSLTKITKKCKKLYDNILDNFTYEKKKIKYLKSYNLRPFINEDITHEDILYLLVQNGITKYNNLISRFTPISIIEDILNNYNTLKTYIFTYKTNKVIFNIYLKDEYNHNMVDIITKATKVFLFVEYFNIKDKNINIHFCPTQAEKYLENTEYIGINSVNSGFTTFMGEGVISIFRNEESDKVLVHELVHLLELDFALNDNTFINNMIIRDFNINKDSQFINFFEAYTDSIGIIFNSIFNCVLTNSNINDYFKKELDYMEDTILIILEYFNIENIKELFNKKGKILIQKTSVLSYYILKFGILLNVEYFLENFLNIDRWERDKILDLYTLSITTLKNYNLNYNSVNKSSMKMSYNELIYK